MPHISLSLDLGKDLLHKIRKILHYDQNRSQKGKAGRFLCLEYIYSLFYSIGIAGWRH